MYYFAINSDLHGYSLRLDQAVPCALEPQVVYFMN